MPQNPSLWSYTGDTANKTAVTGDSRLTIYLTYATNLNKTSNDFTYMNGTIGIQNTSPDNCSLSNINLLLTIDDTCPTWDLSFVDDKFNYLQSINITLSQIPTLYVNFGKFDNVATFRYTAYSEDGNPMQNPGTFNINIIPTYTIASNQYTLSFDGTIFCSE